MGHVHHQKRADFIGDFAEAFEIDLTRVRGRAGEDELRLFAMGDLAHLVVIDQVIVGAHAVRHRLKPLAGNVDRRAVGQVAAAGEIHAEKFVARLQQREEHRLVGVGARVRLHVGEGAVEQALGAIDGQALGFVDKLAAAIIAPPRIALGVFVGQHRTLRLQHRARDDVFRGDQFDLLLLTAQFGGDGRAHVGIGALQRSFEKAVTLGGVSGWLAHAISPRIVQVLESPQNIVRLGGVSKIPDLAIRPEVSAVLNLPPPGANT